MCLKFKIVRKNKKKKIMIKACLNQIKASTALLVLCIKDGNQSSNNQKLESMLKFLHDYPPLPSPSLAGLKGGGEGKAGKST